MWHSNHGRQNVTLNIWTYACLSVGYSYILLCAPVVNCYLYSNRDSYRNNLKSRFENINWWLGSHERIKYIDACVLFDVRHRSNTLLVVEGSASKITCVRTDGNYFLSTYFFQRIKHHIQITTWNPKFCGPYPMSHGLSAMLYSTKNSSYPQ